MYKFIEKSIRRKFVKNANERGHKFLAKNSKVWPPANSETRTDSANVYKSCFMQIWSTFSVDKKYLRLVKPRGRKFGVNDTPQNFEVQPPVSRKQIERPPNFFPRGFTNRKYFLSTENVNQICIKQLLHTLALSVIVLELTGGRTFDFFAENLWPRSFAFLTNFRRIDFPINLYIDAHCQISNLTTRFWDKGAETFLGPT